MRTLIILLLLAVPCFADDTTIEYWQSGDDTVDTGYVVTQIELYGSPIHVVAEDTGTSGLMIIHIGESDIDKLRNVAIAMGALDYKKKNPEDL